MRAETDSALYVYGVVPADARWGTIPGAPPVDVITCGRIAAVVGEVSAAGSSGMAEDVRNHDKVVAELLRQGVPVLPMRFGAQIGDRTDLERDFLAPNAEAFADALDGLRGLVQFTLQVRYRREGLLREIVESDPQIASARATAKDPQRGNYAAQIRLGELVVNAIAVRHAEDAERVRQPLQSHVRALHCTLLEDPDRVADIACLVETDRVDDFTSAAEQLAREHAKILHLKLIGPIAPYDFVSGER